jgi:hypothetical protein
MEHSVKKKLKRVKDFVLGDVLGEGRFPALMKPCFS